MRPERSTSSGPQPIDGADTGGSEPSTTAADGSPVSSPLGALGLDATSERVYRVLLRNPRSTLFGLSEMVGLPPEELRGVLDRLVDRGLLEPAGDVPEVVRPDLALGRVISGQTQRLAEAREQLDGLRAALPSLMADHVASTRPMKDRADVELVEGGDVLTQLRGLVDTTGGELLWFRPDQWRLPVTGEVDELVRSLILAGRPSRALYPARVLEEAPEVVRVRAEVGERVRVLAEVPCRLAIVGRVALISEQWGYSTGRRLVVREQAMVQALKALFEAMWDRAVPVPGFGDGGEAGGVSSDDPTRLLLDQLARGAKDEQIARATGMSLRTVRRRVAALLEELGAGSRFQAGVEAARRGWL